MHPRHPDHPRRVGRVGRPGRFALPRHVATAAHLCALFPHTIQTGLGPAGVTLGTDRLAGGGFHFDLFTAYEQGLIQGPNMLVCGAGAAGKSAIMKAYLHRAEHAAAVSGRGRFTAVIDPKGEWTALADRLGWTALRLRPDGDLRINPLDAGPATGHSPAAGFPAANGPDDGDDDAGAQSGGSSPAEDALRRRTGTVSALLAVVLDQPRLTPGQTRLITAALTRLAARTPDPTLVDLRRVLAHPDRELAADLDTTTAELTERRRPLLDACATLLEHDLRGIADGPTSPGLAWDSSPGLVIDLSALLTDRRALKLVLTAAAGWLQAVMYGQPHLHKVTVLDEAWVAFDDLPIVRFLQDQWRLGRQWGTANILITHSVADLQSQVDTGAAQGSIARGLLNTTSVRVFLRQNPEQATALADLGLTTTETALLDTLPPLSALWHVGDHATLVDHTLTDDEWDLADTDTAMHANT